MFTCAVPLVTFKILALIVGEPELAVLTNPCQNPIASPPLVVFHAADCPGVSPMQEVDALPLVVSIIPFIIAIPPELFRLALISLLSAEAVTLPTPSYPYEVVAASVVPSVCHLPLPRGQ